MIDLHRHDEFSILDGMSSAEKAAIRAKELGYTALGLSNHGNTHGLVRHNDACQKHGIKPILGVEAYFVDKWDPNNKTRGHHLCLFAKDKEGYHNLNVLASSGEKYYYHPIIDLEDLYENRNGIICTSACIAGMIQSFILAGDKKSAYDLAKKFKDIFGDDFYFELQPFKVADVDKRGSVLKSKQERCNKSLISLGKKLGIKTILTSDSHFLQEDHLDTYIKMHAMKNRDPEEIRQTYKDRFMPEEGRLESHLIEMHSKGRYAIDCIEEIAEESIANLQEIADKVDDDILCQIHGSIPKYEGSLNKENKDSWERLRELSYKGLIKRGLKKKSYKNRIDEELEVIKAENFEDYFLIVADYILWAKSKGIAVGPGRGSGCNLLVNYALGVTDTDPIIYKLNYERFIRLGKKKMPDIDCDFESSRRHEVFDYLQRKYKNVAKVALYGLFRVNNLINDLSKVCGVDKEGAKIIKDMVLRYQVGEEVYMEDLKGDPMYNSVNEQFDNILVHFERLNTQIKYIGAHAAGLVITNNDIHDYTSISKKGQDYFTSYSLVDIEELGVLKFDILGLRTMDVVKQTEDLVGKKFDYQDLLDDERTIYMLKKGLTIGSFQLDMRFPRQLCKDLGADCIEDVIAVNALNRPGSLDNDNHTKVLNNKHYGYEEDFSTKYAKETYGVIIYQEQIMQFVTDFAGYTPDEAEVAIKMQKSGSKKQSDVYMANYNSHRKKFMKAVKEKGIDKKRAETVFESLFSYSFNKGHSTGYSLLGWKTLFLRANYPVQFWASTLDNTGDENKRLKYEGVFVQQDNGIILPTTINAGIGYTIKFDEAVQRGITTVKGIGWKAANAIVENGPYIDKEDFIEKTRSERSVTKKTVECLESVGAFVDEDGSQFEDQSRELNEQLMKMRIYL